MGRERDGQKWRRYWEQKGKETVRRKDKVGEEHGVRKALRIEYAMGGE